MKKTFKFLIFSLCLGTLVTSCDKQVDKDLKPTSSEKDFQSEVEQLEKQTGVKYFKKDVILRDNDNNNEVVMRFASTDESVLSNYLQNTNLTLEPVFAKSVQKTESVSSKLGSTSKYESQAAISVEAISIKLQKGAIGYILAAKTNSLRKGDKNTRPAWLSQHFEMISPVWPESFSINIKTADAVQLGWDCKDRWYTGWYNCDGGYRMLAGPSWFSQGVDGPYKVKVHVWCDLGSPEGWEVIFYA
ncbi:hypothetical protein G8759_33160 [Spirosoma aureum]|uniref:Uncharacterized protein n=1 Tax=Spirosoma aureum TaxID=2692134 RepID=A0A6G9AXN6_9BACT|nr:hypothetical protein [Spirosoma aureum]QIP17144.1 hypothetical protein G8759_33160 [Spirosoma aureum]